MIIPLINRTLQESEQLLGKLAESVKGTLTEYCSKNKGFAFSDRIKDTASLCDKIETGRFKNWSLIDDLYAATVIVPIISDENGVLDFLRNTFETVEIKKRGSSNKKPEIFRFDSTRYIGKLKGEYLDIKLREICFEVQVKTAFEYAWSVATHSLTYKSEDIDWKLSRLVAQLKSSVEQLDMIVSGAREISNFIFESPDNVFKTKKYIMDRTTNLLRNENIPNEVKPKDLSRFVENLYSFFSKEINEKEEAFGLSIFFDEVERYTNQIGKDGFPRSISLMQLFIGVCIEGFPGFNKNQKYIPLVTEELEMLFPQTKTLDYRFLLRPASTTM